MSEIVNNYKSFFPENNVYPKIITNELFNNFSKIINHKIQNNDIYKSTYKLLDGYKNIDQNDFDIDECLDIYESNKVIIPLMIYQNYHNFVEQKHHIDIIQKLSTADIFENYIYCEQNWDLVGMHGIIGCAIPSYYANKYNTNKENIKLVFTDDLNKTSFKKKKQKYMNTTNSDLQKQSLYFVRNKTIDEFIYIEELTC